MARKPRSYPRRRAKTTRLARLARTPLGKARTKPEDALSLRTLLLVREAMLEPKVPSTLRSVRVAAGKKAGRTRRARARRKPVPRDTFKAPRGRHRGGLLPDWAEMLAAWPEEMPAEWPGRHHQALLVNGWVEVVERRLTDRYINAHNSYKGCARTLYALTPEGVAARAWLRWVRARRMLGWPMPVVNAPGRPGGWVRFWIRGEPFVTRRTKGLDCHGYLPGDAEDEAWPEMERFPLHLVP